MIKAAGQVFDISTPILTYMPEHVTTILEKDNICDYDGAKSISSTTEPLLNSDAFADDGYVDSPKKEGSLRSFPWWGSKGNLQKMSSISSESLSSTSGSHTKLNIKVSPSIYI